MLKFTDIISKLFQPKFDSAQQYWSQYHVETPEGGFTTADNSLDHLDWRNKQYPGYIELMPVDQADDLVVMDYGNGPGNDLVGFGVYSKPKELHGVDVSPLAISIAKDRTALHDIDVEFHLIDEKHVELPFQDDSIDLIHSSGVLHHTPDPGKILNEFKRILKPDGYAQIMVYNYDSIWMHLYTVYHEMILKRKYTGMTKRQAYEATMDGSGCPIALCYKFDEFIELAAFSGLKCEYLGSSMSILELDFLSQLYNAIRDARLDAESRKFLSNLTFNEKKWPLYNGHVAGVNSCFKLTKL